MDLAEMKRRARGEASKTRAEAHRLLQADAGGALAARGLPVELTAQRQIVSGFFPYKSEISTVPLLTRLAGEGWSVALPIVVGQGLPLVFRAWQPGDATVPGIWGIPMPPESNPEVLPDVLLVPMLAFDRAGYRLGYGGGFYDRTLEKLRKLKPVVAVGVAYSAQEVDAVPHGAHDQPLNFIMTEKATLTCG